MGGARGEISLVSKLQKKTHPVETRPRGLLDPAPGIRRRGRRSRQRRQHSRLGLCAVLPACGRPGGTHQGQQQPARLRKEPQGRPAIHQGLGGRVADQSHQRHTQQHRHRRRRRQGGPDLPGLHDGRQRQPEGPGPAHRPRHRQTRRVRCGRVRLRDIRRNGVGDPQIRRPEDEHHLRLPYQRLRRQPVRDRLVVMGEVPHARPGCEHHPARAEQGRSDRQSGRLPGAAEDRSAVHGRGRADRTAHRSERRRRLELRRVEQEDGDSAVFAAGTG